VRARCASRLRLRSKKTICARKDWNISGHPGWGSLRAPQWLLAFLLAIQWQNNQDASWPNGNMSQHLSAQHVGQDPRLNQPHGKIAGSDRGSFGR